jgi:DNA polymerase (family 10)
MSGEQMTRRILRAMENRYATILAHPTGRLIGTRPPYAADLEQIFKEAKARRIFLEINSQAARLDLNDSHCKFAKEIGAPCVISTDAHSSLEFRNMRYGVLTARRGGLRNAMSSTPCPWPNSLRPSSALEPALSFLA